MSIKKSTIDNLFSERLKIFIKDILNVKQKNFAEKVGISESYISAILKKDRGISAELIIGLYIHYREYFNWLLTGKGEMIRQGAENDTSMGEAGDPLGADPEVVDFLKMTRAVLESGTAYSDTLIANIRLSHHAMESEKRLKGIEGRLGKLEKTKKILKEKATRIREGDNEAEKGAILEKRVACFN